SCASGASLARLTKNRCVSWRRRDTVRFMSVARLTVFFAVALVVSAQGLVNRRAPSFSLPDSALKQYDILDYRGRWLLLGFIGTGSADSKEFSKKLETVKAKHGSKVGI